MRRDRDRSLCDHYLGRNERICSFSCYDEPRCITDEPAGGWPLVNQVITYLQVFEPERADPERVTWTELMASVSEILLQRVVPHVESLERVSAGRPFRPVGT